MSIPDSEWRADGGVTPGSDAGGDIQHGTGYTVRYVRPDVPGAEINVTFYAVEYDDLPGEFIVQRHVEWTVSDNNGNEFYADTSIDDVSLVMDTVAEAEQEAQDFAAAALELGFTHHWAGEPENPNGAN